MMTQLIRVLIFLALLFYFRMIPGGSLSVTNGMDVSHGWTVATQATYSATVNYSDGKIFPGVSGQYGHIFGSPFYELGWGIGNRFGPLTLYYTW